MIVYVLVTIIGLLIFLIGVSSNIKAYVKEKNSNKKSVHLIDIVLNLMFLIYFTFNLICPIVWRW